MNPKAAMLFQESHQIGLYVTLIVLVASFGTVSPYS
jgi:hypothetical protein